MGDALWSSVCLALGLALAIWGSQAPSMRVRRDNVDEEQADERGGMLAVVDAVKAYVRSGGALSEAFAGQMSGASLSSTPTIPDVHQLRVILAGHAKSDETGKQISQMASELDVACRLSDTLGCEASKCLDAVAASYRRMRLLDNQVAGAFATPKATVKLLTALPVGTVVLSELLGAHSLAFLLGTMPGRVCLALGAFIYVIGLMWMRILMGGISEKITGQ